MSHQEILYIASEDLYRLGNASSSLISRVRTVDMDTNELNGITIIIANGKGISLYSKMGLEKISLSGWVWEIKAGTVFPLGLELIKDTDDKPQGHYTLAPARNMPYSEYISLLENVAIQCQKVFRKKA